MTTDVSINDLNKNQLGEITFFADTVLPKTKQCKTYNPEGIHAEISWKEDEDVC